MKKLLLVFVLGFILFFPPIAVSQPTTVSILSLEKDASERDVSKDFDWSLFNEVWELVKNSHYERNNLNYSKIVAGAINGALRAMDPYSRYLNSEDAESSISSLEGEFVGIGVGLELKKRYTVIEKVFVGSPAERAGLKIGDKISEVDGVLVKDSKFDNVLKLINGKVGTLVNLGVIRKGDPKPLTFKIHREKILVQTVLWKKIKKSGKNIAVLQITGFDHVTPNQFIEAINKMCIERPDGIILDLRDNPGGYVDVAVFICSQFVGLNKTIFYQQDSIGLRTEVKSYCYEKTFGNIPITVLVNENSASASELTSACLRDNLGVKLIGEKTYGKGTVCTITPFRSGRGTCVISTAYWISPKGVCIEGKGLEPDIEVIMEDEDIFFKRDPQMEEAKRQILREIKAKKK